MNVSDDSPHGEEHDVQSHVQTDRYRHFRTSIVETATILTSFKANTKETTKQVVRPKAAPPLYIGFE